MRNLLLAPSILSADFSRLGDEVRELEAAGADWVHLDIMDGRFVPNLTFGPFVTREIRKCTSLPLDSHLMVEDAESLLEPLAKAGVGNITVHQEAVVHLDRVIERIRSLGCQAGVALNPSTPVETLEWILPKLDLVMVMSVNPGFGGQAALPYCLDKMREVRRRIDQTRRDIRLIADGGVNLGNLSSFITAGADVLVAGSAIFQGGHTRARCREFAGALRGHSAV